MLKKFLMKKMMKSQMKGVPEEQQKKAMEMIDKNPDLFANIAKEVQAEMKAGKDQMTATMTVMQRHQDELKKLI